jgi:hypothetical protein
MAVRAATAQTVINLISATNDMPIITEIGVGFDGTAASAPALVELLLSSQVGAGTPGSSPSPQLIRGFVSGGSAAQSTAGISYSAEPTVLTLAKQWLVTPTGGQLIIQFPLGREPSGITSGGSGAGKGYALRITSPQACNCRAYMEFEE